MIAFLKKLLPSGLTPYVISRIRTFVPIAVGAALVWVNTRYGIAVDEVTSASMATVVTGLVAGVYYDIVRRLEKRWPRWGWLLGYPSQPSY